MSSLRLKIFESFNEGSHILEIGAGPRPIPLQPGVKRFVLDAMTEQELFVHFSRNYKSSKFTQYDFIHVDFVTVEKRFDKHIDIKFDGVISSNNIEHTPCLISHLTAISKVLKPTDSSMAMLIVPDKRCTFDNLRGDTKLSDALCAFFNNDLYTCLSLYEFKSRAHQTNPGRLIRRSDMNIEGIPIPSPELYQEVFYNQNSEFQDFHRWVFTRLSFLEVLIELGLLGLIDLTPVWISDTVAHEFLCVLKRFDLKNQSVKSSLEDSLRSVLLQKVPESFRL